MNERFEEAWSVAERNCAIIIFGPDENQQFRASKTQLFYKFEAGFFTSFYFIYSNFAQLISIFN